MTLFGSVGNAQGLDAREAGMQAAYQALNQLETAAPALGVVISHHRYDPQLVLNGVSSVLPGLPLMGFSTSAGVLPGGPRTHAVIVALLGGDALQAESHWFPTYGQASGETATRLAQLIGYEQRPAENVLVFADGMSGSAEEFCAELPAGLRVMGCLSGSEQNAAGHQIAGAQAGRSGLAAALLRGENMRLGVGYGHGWHPVGSHFRVTRTRGAWVRTLDGIPASEAYARLFGQPVKQWSLPPLNTLARIYPLAFEQEDTDALLIRSPLRVEADGSFRMNVELREGSDAFLMVGSPDDCLRAARSAARQALEALGEGAKPALALVLVDAAWQMLLQARPGEEVLAVQEALGGSVPVAGGYTVGQIVPPESRFEKASFLNQHMLVLVFGEKKS